MKLLGLLALVVACKSEQAEPPPAPARTLGVAAEIRGPASLVPATHRFALQVGTSGWYEAQRGALVEQPAIGAAIAQQIEVLGGVVDVRLGTTPILIGGEEHREQHLRITPQPIAVDVPGLATKVETLPEGREVWAYTHELASHLAFVTGRTVEPPPVFERLHEPPETASPVSRRLCEVPQVQDIAASDGAAFALVVECHPDAPLRVIRYEGGRPTESRVASRAQLGTTSEQLAVSRSGKVKLVGIRDGKLAIHDVERGTTATYGPVSRILVARAADDGAVWTLVLANTPALLRDGQPVDLEGRAPAALGYDDVYGIVVLAVRNKATWLLAEHPGSLAVLAPRP